ncbi:Tat pathway signal protein [Flavihumibacter sp. UBA7668]|uniref:Tat pathway signal protein n=1 Tax=Flavihumibacter sp. UBA7668 TaxID=1946542 RepID=UPI0025C3972B|nr:Tat pathway signal protein [Flavihumibacter sp. UBA7668]
MSNRRNFIKNSLLTTASLSLGTSLATAEQGFKKNKAKHWIWTRPNKKDSEAELVERYGSYAASGVRGVLFEDDSELHFRVAKKMKLEAHRWNWTMNKGVKTLMEQHPEWYAVSREGKSVIDHPPYVGYYRWLCPSKPEVQAFLKEEADQILSKDYIDGLHLDYIRFCDVILPLNLWKNYNLVQQQELPPYDFCYCETCRAEYKKQAGKDPLDLPYPDGVLSWRLFRYNAINNVVNQLAEVANKHKKWITAAVFPTPEVARRIVRQDWTNWNLDAVFPMIYHKFYQEDVKWIGDAVTEGVHFLAGKFPLYAGLYLPDFENMEELKQGIELSMQKGAAGVSLFGNVTPEVLATLKSAQLA